MNQRVRGIGGTGSGEVDIERLLKRKRIAEMMEEEDKKEMDRDGALKMGEGFEEVKLSQQRNKRQKVMYSLGGDW